MQQMTFVLHTSRTLHFTSVMVQKVGIPLKRRLTISQKIVLLLLMQSVAILEIHLGIMLKLFLKHIHVML